MNKFTATRRRLWWFLAIFMVIVLIFIFFTKPDAEVYPRISKWKGIASKGTAGAGGQMSIDAQILHQPSWVDGKGWGLTAAAKGHGVTLLQETQISAGILKGSSGDQEVEIAWTNFFNGTTNGLVLELGAMDGKVFSGSEFFEKEAGWKAILLEASSQALDIPHNRPNALSLQLAVCQKASTIHFVNAEDVGGILEFMTPEYLKELHPSLLKAQTSSASLGQSVMEVLDWDKVAAADYVVQLPCFPLQSVQDRFQFDHINFLILDLEGGELAALRSLDFSRIHFDVMCIETNRFKNESDPYIDQVVNFVTGKGYKLYKRTMGRNSWFVSPGWKKP